MRLSLLPGSASENSGGVAVRKAATGKEERAEDVRVVINGIGVSGGSHTLDFFGTSLAIIGTIISIVGVYQNNILHNHYRAMQVWMYSNIFLCGWEIGNAIGLWNGGISTGALAVLYGVFTVTNVYGLMKYKPLF